MRRVAAVAGVAAVVVLSVPVRASAATLGGFQASASASPVMVWAYEPNLVVLPTSGPQGELDFAYSRASTETGPQSKGLASAAWPGDIVGDGLPGITGNDSTQYPVKSESSAPAGKADDSQEAQPGVGSASHSDATGTQSRSGITGAAAPPAPLPAPITGDLVHAAAMTSTSTVHNGSDAVSAAAHSTAQGVDLLGGLIDIQHVDVSSAASSDAVRATAGGTSTVTGVSVAGHALKIDQNGVTLSDGPSPPPVPVPQNVVDELRKDGITITQATTSGQATGPGASLSANGLVITVDTGPLRTALDAPASAIYQALPPDVRAQLAPVFAVHPKLVFFVGSTQAASAATTGSGDLGDSGGDSGGTLGAPAPAGGDTGGGATSGGAAGSGSASIPGSPVPDAAGAVPGGAARTVATRMVAAPPAAPGVSGWVLGWALAAAGVIGLGARRLGAAVLAGPLGACVNGGATGIPNLRED